LITVAIKNIKNEKIVEKKMKVGVTKLAKTKHQKHMIQNRLQVSLKERISKSLTP
jgi:hypothetical protein